MGKVRKKIGCFSLVCFLIISNFMIAKAEALPDVMSGSATLADNIMSYYALSGSAIANTDWINTLYSSYGSSFGTIEQLANQGYLVLNDSGVWEPVEQLAEMIEEAPAYSSLGLNEMFNISAEEAAVGGGFAAASGGSVLAGSLGGVASNGVIPLFGGVTAAYWGGIAIGTLAAHIGKKYAPNIFGSIPVNVDVNINDYVAKGAISCGYKGNISLNYGKRIYSSSSDVVSYYYLLNTSYVIGFYNFSTQQATGREVRLKANGSVDRDSSLTISGKSTKNVTTIAQSGINDIWAQYYFPSQESFSQELSKWKDMNTRPQRSNRSPDIIGPDGNQFADFNNGEYQTPDIKPQIDPGTQAGVPLSLQDWLNFANGVNNNNSQTDPFPNNQRLFDNILDLIRQNIPGENPNPNPNPGGDPYNPPVITPVPDPTYPDPVPDQPTSENPEESENPSESENPQETEPLNPVDTGKPWMLPDLTKKFPFCIPWDIKDCFTLLKSNIRQAPHITWRFNPPNTPIDYTFNLDLSDFEPVAILLRTLELIAFIVGLAFATRYLIGAS